MTSAGNPAAAVETRGQFARDVRDWLTRQPRQLPCRYLYDALGSALFEAICQLPWYRLTRAELRLLARAAPGIFATPYATVVELGPGSGEKMAALITHAGLDERPLEVHLVDVSTDALRQAARTLEQIAGVRIVSHEGPYERGLRTFAAGRSVAGPGLAMLLGSNIGNFDAAGASRLIREIRSGLEPGDGFLIGADLIKPEPQLLLAYDDPLGVTAAFNRNLLVRINTELNAQIDVGGFAHRARWNPVQSRMEMHLVSLRPQRIVIPAADVDVTMAQDETIWTESSYKYEPRDITALLEQGGFEVSAHWIDDVDRFALMHARAV